MWSLERSAILCECAVNQSFATLKVVIGSTCDTVVNLPVAALTGLVQAIGLCSDRAIHASENGNEDQGKGSE